MNERFQRGSVQEIQQKCSVGRDPTHGAVGKPKGLIPPPSPPPIRLERLRWTKKRRQFSIKTGEKGTVKELLLEDLPLKRVRREHEELSRAHVLNFSSTTASRAHVRAWVS